MKIYITNNTDTPVSHNIRRLIKSAVQATVDEIAPGGLFEVSVMMTNNDEIRELNLLHRNMDKPTDVLSFPMDDGFCPSGHEGPENVPAAGPADPNDGLQYINLLGDIVISIEQAKLQAENYGHSLEREIGFLTVHSMLHLFGFDHKTTKDETEMFSLQDKILTEMELIR